MYVTATRPAPPKFIAPWKAVVFSSDRTEERHQITEWRLTVKPIYFLWGTLGITFIGCCTVAALHIWGDGSTQAVATISGMCVPTIVAFVGVMCSLKNGAQLDHLHTCVEQRTGAAVEAAKESAKVAVETKQDTIKAIDDAKKDTIKAIVDPASVTAPTV